jgi:hypothetical protein
MRAERGCASLIAGSKRAPFGAFFIGGSRVDTAFASVRPQLPKKTLQYEAGPSLLVGIGVGGAHAGRQQSDRCDKGGNNAFHGDSSILSVNAIASRSLKRRISIERPPKNSRVAKRFFL